MQVIKRDGSRERVRFDKITTRIRRLCEMEPRLSPQDVDPVLVAQQVIAGVRDGITTSELDDLASSTASYMSADDPGYERLAARIAISNMQKNMRDENFVSVVKRAHAHVSEKNGLPAPLIRDEIYEIVMEHADEILAMIDMRRDFLIKTMNSFRTMMQTYSFKINGEPIELPQFIYMRVAIELHRDNMQKVKETYDLLSLHYFTHATPTLINASGVNPQLSSCFLSDMKDDSIEGIYSTLKDCARISKSAGGIGLLVQRIRAGQSYIRGTNGHSNGLVPMLRVFNDTARYVDQCFTPDTHVFTDGGWKMIHKIRVGDQVLSHAGRFCRVERVLEHEIESDEQLLEFSVAGAKIRVTNTHQILVVRITNRERSEFSPRMFITGRARMLYLDACDVTTDDYLVFPKESAATFDGCGGVTHQDLCLVHIDSIDCVAGGHDGIVYDFEIEDDHTYVTRMGVAHNGGGRRKGAFAIYIEPWHADVFEYLELKRNHGKEELRARDLYYGLMIPDLFMKRLRENGSWTLFCPNEAPDLYGTYGEEFERIYERYEREGKGRRTIPAAQLWLEITTSMRETGTPFLFFKDTAFRLSNHRHLVNIGDGAMLMTNLCTEILQVCSPNETAVCTLASIALPKFLDQTSGTFDHEALRRVVHHITYNLNRVIDVQTHPIPEARRSSLRHRAIGIGVQGLADLFCMMSIAWESDEARKINREIFETIYFAALEESVRLAEIDGPYDSFKGSDLDNGILQFDKWSADGVELSGRWNFDTLRGKPTRNSLLIGLMPTATTSRVLGNNECIEPVTSNIYSQRVLAGDFIYVNEHLVKELKRRKLWNREIRERIIADGGSVQKIKELPQPVRDIYKTVWEIPQRTIIDLAADRAPFIDQSQSLNIHIADPTHAQLTSLYYYAWKKNLITTYYLRRQPATQAIKFTIEQQRQPIPLEEETVEVCYPGCDGCGA